MCGLGLRSAPCMYFDVISKFTSSSASTTKSNQKDELENVKLELAEMKNRYAKLSADLADTKEVLGGLWLKEVLLIVCLKHPAMK